MRGLIAAAQARRTDLLSGRDERTTAHVVDLVLHASTGRRLRHGVRVEVLLRTNPEEALDRAFTAENAHWGEKPQTEPEESLFSECGVSASRCEQIGRGCSVEQSGN